ncbi:unnamed protein product [Amoebophrya sp. A25]|nr:unnamed protein product [Amoebophrya sp. A25]|eukprot:GSA25T00006386001.1
MVDRFGRVHATPHHKETSVEAAEPSPKSRGKAAMKEVPSPKSNKRAVATPAKKASAADIPSLTVKERKLVKDGLYQAARNENFKAAYSLMCLLDWTERWKFLTDFSRHCDFPRNHSRALSFHPDAKPDNAPEVRADKQNRYFTLGLLNDRPYGKFGRDSTRDSGLTLIINALTKLHEDAEDAKSGRPEEEKWWHTYG